MARSAKTDATRGSNEGATLSTEYLDRQQRATIVSMDDLEEFQTSTVEEFWQFTVGEFFAAGGFWLLFQRITADIMAATSVLNDLAFWGAVFALLLGLIVGFFGLKQLKRKKSKIQRIIAQAETKANQLAETSTVGTGGS